MPSEPTLAESLAFVEAHMKLRDTEKGQAMFAVVCRAARAMERLERLLRESQGADLPTAVEKAVEKDGGWGMNRIIAAALLLVLRRYWNAHPDLRLCQIIGTALGPGDHYYVEDIDLLAKMLDVDEKHG